MPGHFEDWPDGVSLALISPSLPREADVEVDNTSWRNGGRVLKEGLVVLETLLEENI
jgi:hypothetical protein